MKEENTLWSWCAEEKRKFESIYEERVAGLSKIFLDACCAFLCVCSARTMLSDVYSGAPCYVSDVLPLFLLLIVVSAVMEAAPGGSRKRCLLCRGCALLLPVLLVGCYFVFGAETEGVWAGAKNILSWYIRDWNEYYETAITCALRKADDVRVALHVFTVVAAMGLFYIAKRLGKNLIMAALPMSVLVLELMIGRSPGALGLSLCFIGILISNTRSFVPLEAGTEQALNIFRTVRCFEWIVTGIGACLLCTAVALTGTSLAERMLSHTHTVKRCLVELSEQVEGLWNGKTKELNDVLQEELLTNNPPETEGKKLFRIEFEQKPAGSIYLRGSCADKYYNGVWSFRTTEFKDACLKAGYDEWEMSQYLLTLGAEKLYDSYRVRSLREVSDASRLTIQYLEKSETAYIPYFVELEDTVWSVGDACNRKEKELDKLSFLLWDYEGIYQEKLTLKQEGAGSDWEKWYRTYVLEQCLEVPENMTTVASIAAQLEEMLEKENGSSFKKNKQRLEKAELVAAWLEEHMEYSVQLPQLPEQRDAVEYFLEITRTGYCMHFASAAVLILRKMEVPARFATGYLVKEDALKSENSHYYAVVRDEAAHAWAEIYLDDIGWVPIEVTKGYRAEKQEESKDTLLQEAVTEESVMAAEVLTEQQSENPTPSALQETPLPTEKQKSKVKKQNTKTDDFIKNGIWILGGLAVAAALLYRMLYRRLRWRHRLTQAVRCGRTKNAVRMMNREIYDRLCRKKLLPRREYVRDEEYKNALIKAYPGITNTQWERYMEVVKAAAFSGQELSVEEMKFCHEIYEKVMKE